ncbi:LOW QUALITY PROTEIN: hypothetical protein CVT26_013511 [Gymnopilus dilepis]|uniref:CNNM transmembrane domain-containing protein n=1 Tax=Gymnopilus dilepis TaxID=231916 RepID=A0A409Y5I2_9AGAR|nr:LOW QUALITY PROTEIN: hypothetical protein CVT26_013511 [Gymnopilus dilepis]
MSTLTFRRNGLALSMLLVRATFAVRFRGGPSVGGFTTNIGNDGAETGSPEFWYHLAVSVVLVLAGGVFAGLTLGLMGLDELHLQVLSSSSENISERRNAQKVLNLLRRGRHWVLVIVNESLPIFLDNAVRRVTTRASLEEADATIIPQAVCVRYGLSVGATCAPLVLMMMFILAPLAYPTAKILDWILGADKRQLYKKAELKSFLQFHKAAEEPLREDEIAILNGVLELNTKNVESIMTPLRDAVVLSSDDILDHTAVGALMRSGYSRFPVHEAGKPTSFVGLLLIKKLLTYDPNKSLPVSAFPLSILPEAHPSINCLTLLPNGPRSSIARDPYAGKGGGSNGYFNVGRQKYWSLPFSQSATETDSFFQEILSEEIVDETDQYQDNQTKNKARRSVTGTLMRGLMRYNFPILVFLLRAALASPHIRSNVSVDAEPAKPGSSEFWTKVVISVLLVLAGGVFAGLTLGLMGLDALHLRVLATSSDDPKEKKNAQKVLSLMEKGRHWVLVVLLLGNVIVNESLPIFLDSALGGGVAAIVISTAAIGQIIPQAVSVRYGLSVGATCAPLVLCFMYIFAPVAWPIAKLLDYVLGKGEEHTYKKAELKSFLQFHRNAEEPLRDDEIAILNGVLELNTKNVESIMTPLKVFLLCYLLSTLHFLMPPHLQDTVILSSDTILDHKAVEAIGYSRFPVHEAGNPLAFVGLLLVKKLVNYDPSQALPVSAFPLGILPEAHPSINCFQALDYFQTGRAHLLLISKTPGIAGGAIGVITLEDIIEPPRIFGIKFLADVPPKEIISEEIVDETDRYQDNQSKRRAKRETSAAIMRGIVERERRRENNSNNSKEPSERAPLLEGSTSGNARLDALLRSYGANGIATPRSGSAAPPSRDERPQSRA